MAVLGANDGRGAQPVLTSEDANEQTECMSPRVRYNEELNGYHFPYFREQFINREKLPSGSETFRQVVDEITNDLNTIEIPVNQTQTPVMKVRRKSESTMNRRISNVNLDAAQKFVSTVRYYGCVGGERRPRGSPEMTSEHADVQTECMSPRVRYNEELNGYHFPYFREQFINREKLPSGSETFRQVVDEITNDLNTLEIPVKQTPIPVMKVRHKSESTMNRRISNVNIDAAQKVRRVSWGKPTYVRTEDATSFNRPRVSSDSAVVVKKVLKVSRNA